MYFRFILKLAGQHSLGNWWEKLYGTIYCVSLGVKVNTDSKVTVFKSLISSFLSLLFLENKPKKELIRMLQQMGYDSDPVKAWKDAQEKVCPTTTSFMN